MAEILGHRLVELMEGQGLTQSELARLVGLKQPSIGRLISGDTKETGKLFDLAKHLKTTPGYLVGETDDPSYREIQPPTKTEVAIQLDMVAVQEIDLAYGMGGQYLDVQAVEESTVWFPSSWVSQFTKSDPEHLRFCRGDGDSMVPTIGNRDIVLFDLSQNHLNRQDSIWVVAIADIGMIKRVRALPDGSYELHSDNPLVSPQFAADGEMHVIGRVVASIRGM